MIHWLVRSADGCPALQDTHPPSFLSASERQTYAGLAFPKRRREWLLGRWTAKRLLQLAVPKYDDRSLADISVSNDRDGAPYLHVAGEGRLPVCLSISHRDHLAFCALSSACRIGADIERIETRAWAFVRDFFTRQEAERAQNCPSLLRDTLVTVLWSAKESVLKVLRHGLRVDTRMVEVHQVAGIEEAAAPSGLPLVNWHPLQISSALPGTSGIAAWWRSEGSYVFTLAATSSVPIAPVERGYP